MGRNPHPADRRQRRRALPARGAGPARGGRPGLRGTESRCCSTSPCCAASPPSRAARSGPARAAAHPPAVLPVADPGHRRRHSHRPGAHRLDDQRGHRAGPLDPQHHPLRPDALRRRRAEGARRRARAKRDGRDDRGRQPRRNTRRPPGGPPPPAISRGPRRAGDGPRPAPAAVTATGIGGASLLGISLSTKAGSPEFYILTMGLAGTGPPARSARRPLAEHDPGPGRRPAPAPVVMPVLTVRQHRALLRRRPARRHIPPLNRAIGSVLTRMQTMAHRPSCCSPVRQRGGRELFFARRTLVLVQDSHPLAKTTLAYAATTAATATPRSCSPGPGPGVLFGFQRRTSGGILAPALSHLHMVAPRCCATSAPVPAPRPAEITPA